MTTITYKSRTERFYDDFERELRATGLREAIAELQRRLAALEFHQGETPAPISQVSADSCLAPKRKCGRPRISDEVKAQRKLAKAERFKRMMAKPEVGALTQSINRLSAVPAVGHDKTDGVQTVQ